MFLQIFLLLLGFVLLVKGADVFVDSAVGIAKKLNIPGFIIGLTIVAMGTSIPEVVVNITASAQGSGQLALGNVVGSNIFNLLICIGVCAFFHPLTTRVREFSRDFWLSVGITCLILAVVLFSDNIPRIVAALLTIGFVVYTVLIVISALKNRKSSEDVQESDESDTKSRSLGLNIFLVILGAGLIFAGGHLTVDNAISLAFAIGISERVVGLTIVAIGTSLPELVTCLVACKKGQTHIAIGNVIGSNVLNLMLVLGISGMVAPIPVDLNIAFDMVMLLIASGAFFIFAYTGKRVVRYEGLTLFLMYTAYMSFLVFAT